MERNAWLLESFTCLLTRMPLKLSSTLFGCRGNGTRIGSVGVVRRHAVHIYSLRRVNQDIYLLTTRGRQPAFRFLCVARRFSWWWKKLKTFDYTYGFGHLSGFSSRTP
ncbi:hypothetical protein ACFE04_025753 [Oxalis oulophora]